MSTEEDNKSSSPLQSWLVFLVSGRNLDHDHITRELELEPDQIITAAPRRDFYNVWQLNSNQSGSATPEQHFLDLFARLEKRHQKLKSLSREYRLEFCYSIRSAPLGASTMSLSPATLLKVGYIGARIEVEFIK